jgi:short-subunit dehydrogenase
MSRTHMNSLHGCTALITGASSGIGAEMARQLAPHARALVLVARRADRLEALKAELERSGMEIQCHAADLGDAAQVERLLAALEASGTKIDFLINNAGLGDHGLFEDSEWKRVQAMLDVNIKALTRLTHALLPGIIRSGRGAILNVSSIVSYLPMPTMAVYAASKAYVNSFTEALRGELRGTGVLVSALCPGPVDTEFGSLAKRDGEEDAAPAPAFLKQPVERIVREGLRGLECGRARTVPGIPLAVMMFLTALVPIFILRPFLGIRSRDARRK